MKFTSQLRGYFSNIYYGWFMVGIVSAMRILGGGLHGYGFTVLHRAGNYCLSRG